MEDTSTHQYAHLQKDTGRCIMYGLLFGALYALVTWQNDPAPTWLNVAFGALYTLYAGLCWRAPVLAGMLTGATLLSSVIFQFQDGAWFRVATIALWLLFGWLVVPLLTPFMLFVLNPLYNRYLSNWGERESPPYRPHEEK